MAFTNVQTEVPGSPIFLMRMVSKALAACNLKAAYV